MGFYLRKSYRAGPLRVNLSNSGIGVSAGVRGARIGVSGAGRSYVHAGRQGLYYRSNLGAPQSRTRARAVASEPIEITEDTGVTFRKHRPATENTHARGERKESTGWYIVLFGIAVVMSLFMQPAGWLLLALLLVLLGRRLHRRRATSLAERQLSSLVLPPRLLTDNAVEHIRAVLDGARLVPEDRALVVATAYRTALQHVLDDRVISDDEWQYLTSLEQVLDCAHFAAEEKLTAFRAIYLEAIADQELTQDEETTLEHLRRRLGIAPEAVADEILTLAELREIRQIRAGRLPDLDPGVRLQKGESCHFVGEGRLLKSRILRTFQREGQKYKVRGFTIDKEGSLLITNQRILLVHSGTTSIRLDKVLDLELDHDERLLEITRDGAANPVYLTTPDAHRAAAVLATLTGM